MKRRRTLVRPDRHGGKSAPIETAVALQYSGAGAPRVTAKGNSEVADAIFRRALEHDVPIHEDPALAQVLSSIGLGEEIPRELYVAIAEVLAFAYWVSGKPVPPDQGP